MLPAPFENGGTDIREECLPEAFFGIDLFVAFLVSRQLFAIDRSGFGIQLLRSDRGLKHRLDLRLVDVRFVDHVGDLLLSTPFPAEEMDLVKNPKRLVKVNRPEGEIVVAVTPIVKVKTAEH